MKMAISLIIALSSVVALADIPRPQPRPEPGPSAAMESEALNVLLYGAPAAKLAELKAGSNTMVVERQLLSPGVARYTYRSRNCSYGIAGYLCLENKQMSVIKTEKISPDRRQVSYQVSDVTRLR